MAGAVAAVGLAGASALHGVWASGSSWPAADAEDLADLVVGREPRHPDERDHGAGRRGGAPPLMPGAAATIAVAGMLGAAAVLTAGASGLIPVPGRRARDLARLGTRVASGVLMARGGGGLVVSSLGIGTTSPRFRRWNLRLYSPLCLGLGAAAAVASRGR